MKMTRNTLHGLLVVAILILAVFGLSRRWEAEQTHRHFGLVVETTEIQSLSRQSGRFPASLIEEMKGKGLVGVAVNELTGLELSGGESGFLFGPLARMTDAKPLFPLSDSGDLAVIALEEKLPWAGEAVSYLKAKFPDLKSSSKSGTVYLLLPRSVFELEKAGVVPDYGGLELARSGNLPVLFRPAPCPGVGGDRVIASLEALVAKRPDIRGILPQGLFIMGSPNIGDVGEWLRSKGLFLAQAEFNRQLGADRLNRSAYPALVPIHSVTTDEVLVKRLSREAIVERMVRASVERSVPLLLLRSYEIDTDGRTESLLTDLSRIREDLEGRGFQSGWPTPFEDWSRSMAGAAAFGIAISLLCVRLLRRIQKELDGNAGAGETFLLLFGGIAWAFLMVKIPVVARVSGALGSALLATEVSLWALDEYRRPAIGFLGSLFLTVTGGLAIAAFFSTPLTMLRIQPFSGVKATLLLPPILVLMHDLKKGIYPESFRKLILRPMVWLEFILVCLILMAAGILALRSDNTAFVGGWERTLRDLLERTLVARPRTKELFIGYPALVLWYAMARANWGRYAWILPRAAASIGFASAVNSFCHFHTRLPFILFRVFNGWWAGLAFGAASLLLLRYVGLPLARKWGPSHWT
jgi:hypothetical protein